MQEWFIRNGKRQIGPVSSEELKRLADSGRLKRRTAVRPSNHKEWFQASTVPGLFPNDAPVPSPGKEPETASKSARPNPVPADPFTEDAASTPQTPDSDATAAKDTAEPVAASVVSAGGSVPAAQPAVASPASVTVPATESGAAAMAPMVTRSGVSGGVLAAALIGTAVVVGLAGFAAAGGFRSDAELTAEQERIDRRLSELREEIDEAEQSRDELQQTNDKLTGEQKELRNRNEDLRRDQQEIENQIDELTAFRDELLQWQQVPLVMVNPSHVALAVRPEPDGCYEVLLEHSGDRTPLVINAALNAGVSFIPSDPQLTRELAAAYDAGDRICGNSADRISRFYRVHRTLPLIDEQALAADDWVTFFDQRTRSRRIGLHPQADADGFEFVSFDGIERAEKSRILPGSAVRGSMQEIMTVMDEALFLDQCLLRTALALRTAGDGPEVHALALQVEVDAPDRSLSARIPTPDFPEAHRDAPGIVHFIFGVGQLMHHHHRMTELNRERAAVRKLEDAVHYLENELIGKLRGLNVVVFDRTALESLAEDRGLALANGILESNGRQLLLTHTLVVNVGSAQSGGRYHMNVTLRETANQTSLFSESADRVDESVADKLARSERYRPYFLDSGRLATVRMRADATSEFHPVESSPPVRQAGSESTRRLLNVVYVESAEGENPLVYRTMFSKRRHQVPLEDVESVEYLTDPSDVPRHDLVRYLSCRIARNTMPNAGRIRSINGNRATVSIGREGGVKTGDSLRLLRYYDNGYQPVGEDEQGDRSQELLAVRLTVTNVFDHYCETVIERTGFEDVWPYAHDLREGDIVIPAKRKYVSVGVVPTLYQAPDPNNPRLDLRRVRQDFLVREARDLSMSLSNKLTESLAALNIPVRNLTDTRAKWNSHDAQLRELRGLGATHAIGGIIQAETTQQYHVRLGTISLEDGYDHEFLRDSMDFVISDANLPR